MRRTIKKGKISTLLKFLTAFEGVDVSRVLCVRWFTRLYVYSLILVSINLPPSDKLTSRFILLDWWTSCKTHGQSRSVSECVFVPECVCLHSSKCVEILRASQHSLWLGFREQWFLNNSCNGWRYFTCLFLVFRLCSRCGAWKWLC